MLKLKLPWPPSINEYYQPQRRGPKFMKIGISKKAKKYRTKAVKAIHEQLGGRPEPTRRRLKLHILLCGPSHADRDIDNFHKGVFDAMQHAGVYVDDSQIDRQLVQRGPVVEGGQVIVKIRVLPYVEQLTFNLDDDGDAPF